MRPRDLGIHGPPYRQHAVLDHVAGDLVFHQFGFAALVAADTEPESASGGVISGREKTGGILNFVRLLMRALIHPIKTNHANQELTPPGSYLCRSQFFGTKPTPERSNIAPFILPFDFSGVVK